MSRLLRRSRRPIQKILLHLEGRPSGVVLRPLGQAALRAEHLDAEFPQLSQDGALTGQGFPQCGESGPKVGVRRQNSLEPLLELGHPAGGRRAPPRENRQEQSQTDPQLYQAHPLPGARCSSSPPLRWSGRTRSSSSADPLCGLVVHPDPSLIRSLSDPSRYSREVSDIPLDSREGNYYNRIAFIIGVWRSLVSRLVRVQEAPGSNPGTPTIGESLWDSPIFYLYFSFPNSYNYCCMEMCNFL